VPRRVGREARPVGSLRDLAADWFLELWGAVPTPTKAARIRESTVERILKAHRIRRIAAAEVSRILRQPALTVAPGAAEAASAHIRTVAERLKLVNRQIRERTAVSRPCALSSLRATGKSRRGKRPISLCAGEAITPCGLCPVSPRDQAQRQTVHRRCAQTRSRMPLAAPAKPARSVLDGAEHP
jgi:hypothetical protein